MSRHLALRLALAAAAFCLGRDLVAQCSGANHVTWPAGNPVWDFCYKPPSESSTSNGSGLELTDVKYRGVLVLAQAHLPILNVKYAPNENNVCGGENLCYRDWLWQENLFECAPAPVPGYCTGTTLPARTVCQDPGEDFGSFSGVAVESLPDRLRLTTQCQAGWYRYIPIWEFFEDGTVRARFHASSIDNNCVAITHHHHSYFRFDVDLAGGAGDHVDRVLQDGTTQRATTERSYTDVGSARSRWRIGSPGSRFALEVSRNAEDGAAGDPPLLPNDFPVADGWVLAYDPNELADYDDLLSGCAANLNSFDDDENVDGADVVLWVRAGGFHVGEGGPQAHDCSMVGPTLEVVPVATSFHTLAPCRIVDTRNAAGAYGGPALAAGGVRNFVLAGRCGVPPTAKSVAVNLTVTNPTAAGFLTAYPVGETAPLASAVNFTAGQIRANNAVLSLGTAGAVSIRSVLPSGSVHFILDVTGWFE